MADDDDDDDDFILVLASRPLENFTPQLPSAEDVALVNDDLAFPQLLAIPSIFAIVVEADENDDGPCFVAGMEVALSPTPPMPA